MCDPPCLKTFTRADHLKQHKHPKNKHCLLNAEICPQCNVAVKGSLATHKSRKCPSKYSCDDCEQAFALKKDLVAHVRESHFSEILVLVT